MTGDRLAAQLRFLLEIDRLKNVERRNPVGDGSRRENTAEHSWHLAMLALVLVEHAAEPVDIARVVRLLLVHDLVEIDAGDTFAYDEAGHETKAQREEAAADRIFALLPSDQAAEVRAAWDEFESGDTAEARFARSVDRLQPLLLNQATGGATWIEHGIDASRVRAVNAGISEGSPVLWEAARRLIDDAVDRGILAAEPGEERSGGGTGADDEVERDPR